eukprot:TRINITY_DN63815_c0_g1_i1.p1 TRINITY_DN63815_c0_g1~~TRINITY_DN63815_c0_g1_i1.p1  ORF type:complete len:288 (+),score=59.99 TRINITY_DN63815_c0_g1_i1:514-1377(+)
MCVAAPLLAWGRAACVFVFVGFLTCSSVAEKSANTSIVWGNRVCRSRVALCLSGQMRTFRMMYPPLKYNLLKHYKPDVFIHTWSDIGGQVGGPVLKSELDLLYRPCKAVIEQLPENSTRALHGVEVPLVLRRLDPKGSRHALPQFYKMWACNELKKGIEERRSVLYDVVVRMRPDMLLCGPLPMKPRRVLWGDNILVSSEWSFSDKVAVGQSDVMDYYCSVWPRLSEYWKEPGGKEFKTRRLDERLMKYHLDIGPFEAKTFFYYGMLCHLRFTANRNECEALIRQCS